MLLADWKSYTYLAVSLDLIKGGTTVHGSPTTSSTSMATEQFCLRWNDFHANITSAFSDIRDDDDFLDVTLVCDGDIVRAHKLVLSACSPLFRVMLKKNSHPQPMIFLRGIRFPDMVAILNFMYHGEVNVNQEDLQMFLAAAEELRIKGLSQASNDSKLEKLDNSVPKIKQASGGSNTNSTSSAGQPPAKKPRESSPGISPVSTPVSAKSPAGPDDDEPEPPQLSVKREFAMSQGEKKGDNLAEDDDSQQSNLLDCLVQAQQNFAFQQQAAAAAGTKAPGFENNINNFSPQHIMQGAAGGAGAGQIGQMTPSQGDKGLMQFLGQNSANVSSAAANAIMMQRLLGTGYELHPLGSRKDNDPMAHIKVARSSKGWHCPQCIHISSTKGNLKSHILAGRHKTYTEKPFGCQYCDRSYGTKQSLQVHISTNHRAERDAEYQALSKSLGMKSFPDPSFYIKSENFENSLNSLVHNTQNISPAILQQMQQLQGGTPNMKMPELSIIKHDSPKMEYAKVDARDPPSSNGSSLQIIPKQNLQNMNLSSNLASCRMEAKNNMDIHEQINMLKNMDFQKLNSSNHMHMVDEDSEDDENGSPLTPMRHKGDESYPTPSLHPESDSEEGQLHIANVEANMDTSITTP